MSQDNSSIYLNDHLAGSVAGIELLDEVIQHGPDAQSRSSLQQLKSDIEADQRELKALIHRLDATESEPRKAVAWVAGKLADLKSLIEDRSTGPLARLEAFEALALGITGKLLLWRALAAAQETAPRLRGPDYEHLAERASEQRKQVETLRLEAAREAFATASDR